jgi:hypothetical protein
MNGAQGLFARCVERIEIKLNDFYRQWSHASAHEAVDAAKGELSRGRTVGILHARKSLEKGNRAMVKTFEVMSDVLRDPNHLFKKTDNQPKKAMKHRYERRKIKEYLHLGGWLAEEAV